MDYITQIVIALIALAGVIYSARAGRAARAVHAEVVTNHGKRHGDHVEKIAEDVEWLRETMVGHLRDHALRKTG